MPYVRLRNTKKDSTLLFVCCEFKRAESHLISSNFPVNLPESKPWMLLVFTTPFKFRDKLLKFSNGIGSKIDLRKNFRFLPRQSTINLTLMKTF